MNTVAVIVTYNPDFRLLSELIRSIYAQVAGIIIVNNSESDTYKNLLDKIPSQYLDKVIVKELNQNKGIAYAQNIGIKLALEQKANFILLSDQDTVYPADYVESMICNYQNIDNKENVVALVPNFREMNRGGTLQGFIEKPNYFFKRTYPEKGQHEVFQAIASGKFLVSEILQKVGLFDEELFIDWVDLEWCWRAKQKGFRIIGCAEVMINHSLGDSFVRKFKKDVPLRSPIRHYYIVRNGIFLALRSAYLTKPLRIQIGVKVLRQYLGFIILSKDKIENFRFCSKALIHGFSGKLGKYQ